jgi:hypothetical protein
VTVNYTRIVLASLGAMVAYFVYGFAMFAAWPSMKTEFMKYPNVYRPKDEMMKVMPYGTVAIFIAIVVVAILYAKINTAGGGRQDRCARYDRCPIATEIINSISRSPIGT